MSSDNSDYAELIWPGALAVAQVAVGLVEVSLGS